MKNTKIKTAIQMIASSNDITGIHISDGEPLAIDFINNNPEEDDIVICGKDNTIFLEDFEDCIITDNNIKVSNYILHIK